MQIHLKDKILNNSAVISVIGLGYVGLPLAIEFIKAGFNVNGIELSVDKIGKLQNGQSYIKDISDTDVQLLNSTKRFNITRDFSTITISDIIIICVPTPLNEYSEPDISYINSVVDNLIIYMKKGSLIVLESTTYPGCTEEILQNKIESKGFQVGVDFYLCFSPERVDPSNKEFNLTNTTKLVGGTTKLCSELAENLYNKICDNVMVVSSPKVAEFTKLLENTFRSVNIAFINEIAMMCEKMDINVWEVIEAASTKPFGYMPFSPGPGIGGHCIPLDPLYLSWEGKKHNFFNKFIELSHSINSKMPEYIINKISQLLNIEAKSIKGSKIILLGIAYKPEVTDYRESPGIELFEMLKMDGALVDYYDPYVECIKDHEKNLHFSVPYDLENFKKYDCMVLVTNHQILNYEDLEDLNILIFDTRNTFESFSNNVYKLGTSLKNLKEKIVI